MIWIVYHLCSVLLVGANPLFETLMCYVVHVMDSSLKSGYKVSQDVILLLTRSALFRGCTPSKAAELGPLGATMLFA
jgi:hypothetical protein